MNPRTFFARLAAIEPLNFAVTNFFFRHALTRAMAGFSRIEHPWVRDASIAVWRAACDVDLSDAAQDNFASLHAAFTRTLRPGARPFVDSPGVLASPCDGIVGGCGSIGAGTLIQAKGRQYELADLLCDPGLADGLRGGAYVTLRLTAGMYHRFHAPDDLRVRRVVHVPGDVWNVNPPTLARIDRVYCRNERAVIEAQLADGERLALVAVAAVLVSGIRLRFADLERAAQTLWPRAIPVDARLSRGDEMGWFEHGSTIIVAAPRGWELCDAVASGWRVRAGSPLLRRTT
ncbi:MAG: archaetidylserine decarboxylase [Burkholderiales bacterium]